MKTAEIVLTAAHAATALVAACERVEISPTEAFAPGKKAGRARRIAAAGCVARLGVRAQCAARTFHVQALRLAPTKLKDAGITTEDLLVVAEALETAGLTAGDQPAARFRRPHPPAPPEPTPRPKLRPGVERPRPVVVRPAVAKPIAATPSAGRKPAAPAPASARSKLGRPTPPRAMTRLKPVTDRIVRWTTQQVLLGVSVQLMAELFDVDSEVLANLVAPEQAWAA